LRHATWAAVGQSRVRQRNGPRGASYARLFPDLGGRTGYQWSLKPALMLLLLVV